MNWRILRASTMYHKYQSIIGSDFKTLAFPVMNNSYSLKKPGWLNDRIVDAYLLLLVKVCSQKGNCTCAQNSFFHIRL